MTIKIEIEVPTDLVLKGIGSEYLDMAAGALGFTRCVSSVSQPVFKHAEVKSEPIIATDADVTEFVEQAKQVVAEMVDERNQSAGFAAAEAPKRERGKPSQGRARRTKEEIAEDEAADAAVAGNQRMSDADAAKQKEEAIAATRAMQAISTGGERISPEDEQDAADEAAETEKTGLASIDVLRRLVGDYQKKHGMPAAVKLCQDGGLIGKPIHELDDAGIETAIAAMQGGVEVGFLHELTHPEPEAPKTKADLVEAMMRYADKFDGTRDQAKMTHTLADMPKVFVAAFGDSVQKLSQVPEDKYAEAVAAVEAAIKADPYGRAK
jgi:hypothetical protein